MSIKHCLLSLLGLFLCLACASALAEAPAALPIDLTGGAVPDPAGYIGEWEYQDPTIHAVITTGRVDNCDYWMADITIAHASQLRTMSAGGFDSNRVTRGPAMAQRVNAVVAIDGDYYCYTGKGYIVRQGVEYLNILDGDRDLLLIDEDGDFHVVFKAEAGSQDGTVNGKRVINAFFFGPALVVEGKPVEGVTGRSMSENEGRQRMCIAQVGPLHYKAICCAGPARGNAGMTLKQFASFVASQGVQTAYNLDGGDSTMIIFRNEKINDVQNASTRSISDIIYFASAWEGEP